MDWCLFLPESHLWVALSQQQPGVLTNKIFAVRTTIEVILYDISEVSNVMMYSNLIHTCEYIVKVL